MIQPEVHIMSPPPRCNKIVKILLGQPLFNPDGHKTKLFLEQTIRKYGITHYFPHPRDFYLINNVTYIRTPVICEQYFAQQVYLHPDIQFDVYSFCSTATLFLCHLPNVRLVYCSQRCGRYSANSRRVAQVF